MTAEVAGWRMSCVAETVVMLLLTVGDKVVWQGDRVIVVLAGRVAGDSAETNAMLIRAK